MYMIYSKCHSGVIIVPRFADSDAVPVPTLTLPRGPKSGRAGPPAPAGARASADSVASGGPGQGLADLGSESTVYVKAVRRFVELQRRATIRTPRARKREIARNEQSFQVFDFRRFKCSEPKSEC